MVLKFLRSLMAPAVFMLLAASCKKDDPKPAPIVVSPVGNVQVSFTNTVGTDALVTGPVRYTNAAGNRYSVDVLKYYVSHFTLVRDDSTEVRSAGHELIDQADSSSRHFTLDSIPNGKYMAVRFYLGVDGDHNHSGAQEGDLDPVHGMIWTWSTGYMFFKHEGSFLDSTGATKSLFYHFGTDKALSSITIPLNAMELKGDTRSINLRFDLNALYAGPPAFEFNVDNNRMSTSKDDIYWLVQIRNNLAGAFSISSLK
jgi:hypothetical protein